MLGRPQGRMQISGAARPFLPYRRLPATVLVLWVGGVVPSGLAPRLLGRGVHAAHIIGHNVPAPAPMIHTPCVEREKREFR